jgi:hypothetical protein
LDDQGPDTVTRIALCLLAASLSLPASAAGRSLTPGQAVQISGTDMVCAYAGLAHHYGLACALNSVSTAWTFRLEENALNAIHVVNGVPKPAHPFSEPRTRTEPGPSDVTSASIVGQLKVGQSVVARGTDLVCTASHTSGGPAVTCAKERSGRAIVGSYAGVLTAKTMRIERVTAHGAWKVVLSRPSTG